MSRFHSILDGYDIADIANAEGGYDYQGYTNRDGSWRIMRNNTGDTEYRYTLGSSDYSTAWTNRASQNYRTTAEISGTA